MSVNDALILDDRVRCGITLAGLSRASALDEARRAERLGFESLWVTDHLAFHLPITDALTLLGFAAAVTERVTLGTSIYLLPLRPAAMVAKQAASVDLLSGGRLVLGVGVGGEYPPEFEAAGVPIRERGSRLEEAIPLLRRLWSEQEVVHRGVYAKFGPITVTPGPVQSGGPPIWVGGRSAIAMDRAGRLGDGYISHMATPDRYAANLERIAAAARAAGRAPRRFATAAFLFTWVDATEELAAQRAAAELERLYARSFESVVRRYCLLGPPEACRRQMQRYVDAGVRHFVIAPLVDAALVAERLAGELGPEFRTPLT